MNPEEVAVLNALVTFAAENVPGGLSELEQRVARQIGNHTLWDDTLRAQRPIPIATKKADRLHYLHRSAIHQTVCGLPTDKMERYFGVDVLNKAVCAKCYAKQTTAANL